jgi:hypothetical protein
MADEALNSISPVVDRDIPMTVVEALASVTVGKSYVDIPLTVNEAWLGMTVVVGMKDEYSRNFICNDSVSTQNQSGQAGIYIDKGFVFVPVQPGIPNNQISS